jgi:hypothetical protein
MMKKRMTPLRSVAFVVMVVLVCMTVLIPTSSATLLKDISDTILGHKNKNTATSTNTDDLSTSSTNTNSNRNGAAGGECQLALRVLAFDKDIDMGETTHSSGFSTFRYPIYDPEGVATNDPPIGIYIGASTTIGQNNALGDCIGSGSFNFDYDEDTNSYKSQIFVSVSCSGTFNAITGGTGKYAFIQNGHEVIADSFDIEGGSISELHFASDTCV